MTVTDVERIKKLINEAELESAKSQGMIDNIISGWKDVYGISTVEEAEEKVVELEMELDAMNKELKTLYEGLENACDWDKLERELR